MTVNYQNKYPANKIIYSLTEVERLSWFKALQSMADHLIRSHIEVQHLMGLGYSWCHDTDSKMDSSINDIHELIRVISAKRSGLTRDDSFTPSLCHVPTTNDANADIRYLRKIQLEMLRDIASRLSLGD